MVNSCQMSCRILDFFALPNFLGAPLPEVVHTLSRYVAYSNVSYKVTPTNREVIGTKMLNFEPKF